MRILPPFVRATAVRFVSEAKQAQVFFHAQAIAYKGVVATLPILGLAFGLVGGLFGVGVRQETLALLRQLVPPSVAESATGAFAEAAEVNGTLTVGGAVITFVVAVLLFTTLRRTVSFAIRRSEGFRDGWRGRVFDARMVFQVGVLFVVAALVSLVLGPFGRAALDRLLPAVGWAQALSGLLGEVLVFVIPLVLSVAVAFQLFHYVPRPRPPARSALMGAVVTALLWEVTRWGLNLYLLAFGPLHRYNGSLAILGAGLAYVLWIYYVGVGLLLGGVVTRMNDGRSDPPAGPDGQPTVVPGVT